MTRLSEAYDRGGDWPTVARVAVAFVVSLVAAVGFVVTAASLIAGLGFGTATALKSATLLGGALLLATFLARPVRAPGGPRALALAGIGVAAGAAGFGLFWTALPATWTGGLSGLPPVALGTYAVGLVAAFAAWFAAAGDDARTRSDASDSGGSVRDGEALGGVAADSSAPAGVRDAAVARDGPPSEVDSDSATSSGPAASSGTVASSGSAASSSTTASSATAAVGDGGEADDDLEFFDDEDP